MTPKQIAEKIPQTLNPVQISGEWYIKTGERVFKLGYNQAKGIPVWVMVGYVDDDNV